jgi:ABC-type antimicrobial peptide transport system permease subunit
VTGGSDLPSTAVPWLTLSIIGAVLAGVLSAAYPAWRTSRRHVLKAIATT